MQDVPIAPGKLRLMRYAPLLAGCHAHAVGRRPGSEAAQAWACRVPRRRPARKICMPTRRRAGRTSAAGRRGHGTRRICHPPPEHYLSDYTVFGSL